MKEKISEQIKLTKDTKIKLDRIGCKGDNHDMVLNRLIQRYESLAPKIDRNIKMSIFYEGVRLPPLQKPLKGIRVTPSTRNKLDLIGNMNERYEDIILRLINYALG